MTRADDQSTHGHAYSLGEEIANAVTHGIGAALSVAALVILIGIAALWGDGWHLASAIVYGGHDVPAVHGLDAVPRNIPPACPACAQGSSTMQASTYS